MQIVFLDRSNHKPYTEKSLEAGGIGGTEASVIRIAEYLDAIVMQHNQNELHGRYRSFGELKEATHVISLREPTTLISATRKFPNARHFLWLHDLADRKTKMAYELVKYGNELKEIGATIVCVSEFHAAQVRRILLTTRFDPRHVIRIYNPVVSKISCSSSFDPDKMIFFSAPHKGLKYSIRALQVIRRSFPQLTLYVANPGYKPDLAIEASGIRHLGQLSHRDVLAQVADSLCSFHPNFTYPETFGLVLAESNSVGTPVLAHNIGAAPEVLTAEQLIKFPWLSAYVDKSLELCLGQSSNRSSLLARLGAYQSYVQTIDKWRNGQRPLVGPRPEFQLSTIGAEWLAYFRD